MAGEISFEAEGLEELTRDLKIAAREFQHAVDGTLLEIGEELKETAKGIAEQHSKTVAGTIKMRPGPNMVVISAGSDEVPIAALWETGNKGSKADTAKATGVWFRHPVWGTDVWTMQRRFPFLRPALDTDRRAITKQMEATWDRALEPYRLKPE